MFDDQRYSKDDEKDEVKAFERKIKILNNVASDLNSLIEKQNSKLRGVSPTLNSSISRLQNLIGRLTRADTKQFKGWLFYLASTLILLFLIFLLFIVF